MSPDLGTIEQRSALRGDGEGERKLPKPSSTHSHRITHISVSAVHGKGWSIPLLCVFLEYNATSKCLGVARMTYRATSVSPRSSKVATEPHVETRRVCPRHTLVPASVAHGLGRIQCRCHEKTVTVQCWTSGLDNRRVANRR